MTTLDAAWFLQLKPIIDSVGETFVALMPSEDKLRRSRAAFEASGYKADIELYPDAVRADNLRRSRQQADKLLHAIAAQERIPEVRDLYIERLFELMTNIDMILAAHDGDNEVFLETGRTIYGLPDREIFAAACSWLRQLVTTHRGTVGAEICNELLRLIPDIGSDKVRLFPDDDVFQTVKTLHFAKDGYIDQLFAGANVPDDTIITPAIGDPIVRQSIRNVRSDFELADSPNGLWAVLQSQRKVVRPMSLALAKQPFMAIVAHEVGSHLFEATNGALSPLRLLESGLDRYEAGNEGRAFLREQIMYDRFTDYVDQPRWYPTKASWEYRVAIHMVISLAVGHAGRQYGFAELYGLLELLFRFWTAKRGEPIDDDLIRDGAWSMTVRALKGTDGTGGAYLKDIVYLEGNIRCWQAAASRPELILFGDKGKFDIANKRHIRSLTTLGILPAA